MVIQPIPIPPGLFKADREELAQILPLTERVRPVTEPASVTTGAGPSVQTANARQARADQIPVQCLLTVEDGDKKVSLTLPMRSVPIDPPNVYDLETPGTVPGIKLALRVSTNKRGALQLQTNYIGLDVDRILSYARFAYALRREQGIFVVSAYVGPTPLRLATIELPLPFEEADRTRVRQELRFWEAVHEISRETGVKLVCPPEITEDDLRNINVVLSAVRSGWVVERIKDFTIPPTEEMAENLVRVVEQEGDVLRSLALVTENETFDILGVGIDLGKCIRHIAKARLVTPLEEIRQWIASDPERREPLITRWDPVDGVPLHVLFPEWPKPSVERVREDLAAFQDEYGMDTDEFRRAWEAGDPKARAVEDGDIWLTLSNIERALAKRD
jgi:hypothetical protein